VSVSATEAVQHSSDRAQGISHFWRSRSRTERILFLLFLLSLPFIHPNVRWDGIGYYAYLRSPLIDHNFQFAGDWNKPPEKMFYLCRACGSDAKLYWNNPANELLFVSLDGHIYVNPITRTGHLPNFYSVGPAILWLPFVAVAHLLVLGGNHLGWGIPPDGHSWPYIVTLAVATAFYGFAGLFLAFQLAKKYMEEKWAFWAVVGIWFASSLPVYMYLNPSWSHAHSAFCVSLFLWYWDRTRVDRTWKQWILLGLIAGLMLDVYLANGILLLAPALDCAAAYLRTSGKIKAIWENLRLHLLFSASFLAAFSPMLISREIVYGNPLTLGMYASVAWNWRNPAFWKVLFSSDHGMFVWTPILVLAVAGLPFLWRKDRFIGSICLLVLAAFYCLISFDPWWSGTLSFGNRFFVSLTPIFVLGLGSLFSAASRLWPEPRATARRLVPVTAFLILWNFGLIYQWSTHMIPTPGVVQWSEVLYNQFRVVPGNILNDVVAAVTQHPNPKSKSQIVGL